MTMDHVTCGKFARYVRVKAVFIVVGGLQVIGWIVTIVREQVNISSVNKPLYWGFSLHIIYKYIFTISLHTC